jgi:hypothetical protein
MKIVQAVLLVLAFACFIVSAVSAGAPTPPPRVHMLSIGLAFLTLAQLIAATGL